MAERASSRRRLLTLCTISLLSILGGLIGAPVLAFITSPLRRKNSSPETDIGVAFADAGSLDAIPVGQWKLIPVEIVRQDGWAKSRESRSVWVRRLAPAGVTAVAGVAAVSVAVRSPICTHLGCPIMMTPDGTQFRCPCHGGTFDTESGKHIAGPPPRDMDSLDFEIRDGHLLIRWQDFKIGVADRVAVQV